MLNVNFLNFIRPLPVQNSSVLLPSSSIESEPMQSTAKNRIDKELKEMMDCVYGHEASKVMQREEAAL
jgi:hypothetical protein